MEDSYDVLPPPRALLTDLYELTMAASYLRRGMEGPATFSLFVRHLPHNRGFLVTAGLEDCLAFLEGFHFHDHELAYLRERQGFDSATIGAFRALRFTGEVWAVPEGRIVFADEPLLEVTAPIAQGQLIETYLLNQITFQTTLASKAARCRLAARGRDLADFSFRRTQGIEAGIAAARTSAMVGFTATSNVEAARRFGLRATGTMAHSYVEAFPTEADAFGAFVQDFPDRTTFLVDTYDTLNGVRAAIEIIQSLGLTEQLAIRLDSGDLGTLARQARQILDDAGLPQVRIVASGGLDEYDIDELVTSGAPIDAFGVGTRMGVSSDAPYLDTAYKLVQYGTEAVLKLSPGKVTAPGAKQVFRPRTMEGDVIGLRDESPPPGYERLLEPVMVGGRRTGLQAGVEAALHRFEADLAQLPEAARDLDHPKPPLVSFSERLLRLASETRDEIIRRISASPWLDATQ